MSDMSLYEASFRGNVDAVSIALRSNPDLEYKTQDMTALQAAAWLAHTAIVEQLLTAGASPHTADAYGWTALHFAAKGHNSKTLSESAKRAIAELLLAKGANPRSRSTDRGQSTPADVAAGWDFADLATFLRGRST